MKLSDISFFDSFIMRRVLISILVICGILYLDIIVPQDDLQAGIIINSEKKDTYEIKQLSSSVIKTLKDNGISQNYIEVSDGNMNKAFKRVASTNSKNNEFVIIGGFGIGGELSQTISNSNKVSFFVEGNGELSGNATTFDIREYQAQYLAGIVAAGESENGKILYITSDKSDWQKLNINAFVLGAQINNDKQKVYLEYVSDTNDAKEQIDWYIANKHIDTLMYDMDDEEIAVYADKRDIKIIGCKGKMEGLSDNYLTSVYRDYGPVMEHIIYDVNNGLANSDEYLWFGINSGATGITELGANVSDDTRQLVESCKNKMKKGRYIFCNAIYDTDNNRICGRGEAIPDSEMINGVTWFVKGVYYDKD